MRRCSNRFLAFSVFAMLTLAGSQAVADGVTLSENSTNLGQTLNLRLPVDDDAKNYFAGSINISVANPPGSTSTSFLAFCIDPFQYASSNNLTYNLSPLDTLGSQQAADVTKLYSQSYASTANNAANSAAFQLALWELAQDDGVLTSGVVQKTSSTGVNIVSAANNMISAAKNQAAGPNHYSFSLYTHDRKQDFLVATVSPVPEPESYAMLLAGLVLIGFTASKRQASQQA